MSATTKPEKSVRIVRHGAERDFTILRNEAIRDERLSWKATGLLVYIISLPEDWRLYLSDLAKRKRDGRDATRAGLAELEAAGYLDIEHVREGGRFVETVWQVRDVPVRGGDDAEKPYSENPNTENPDTEKPTLERTDSTKNIHTRRTHPNKREKGEAPTEGGKPPLSLEGGGNWGVRENLNGICLQAGNQRDLDALQRIEQHAASEIVAAVEAARSRDPQGRAWPTAVLRTLLQARSTPADPQPTPAWARLNSATAPAQAEPREIDITDIDTEYRT